MVEKGGPEVTRETVLAEIEGWKNNPHKRFSWHSELNNFHAWLPSDEYNKEEGERDYGHIVQMCGLMDTKNCEYHQSDNEGICHSKLFLNQTPREFIEEIDKTIKDIPNISLKKIKKLQKEHSKISRTIRFYKGMPPEEEKEQQKKIDEAMKYLKELYEYTLPVYIELRVKGYNHFDLTG